MITLELINQRIGELQMLHAEAMQTADKYLGAIEECQKIRSFIIAKTDNDKPRIETVKEPTTDSNDFDIHKAH